MKLWIKVAFASTALVLMTLVAVGGLLFFAEKRHLLASQLGQQRESVENFAQVCIESAAEQNDIILINYVLSLSKSPGFLYAYFANLDGKFSAHNDPAKLGQIQPEIKAKVSNLTAFSKLSLDGTDEVAVPVVYRDSIIGAAVIGYEHEYFRQVVDKTMRETVKRFSYVSLIANIFGILGAVIFARGVTKPLDDLTKATEHIGKGELAHRIPVNGSDEIGALGRSFNNMAQKLEELDHLKNDFVSSVSHELRSPLTALKGFLQMFQMGLSGPVSDQQKENLTLMLQCTDRLGRFVNNILDVAKLEAGMMDFTIQPLDPRAVAQEIVALYQPQATSEKVKVVLDAPASVPNVQADSDKLRQVFTNLVNNALKFTPEGGQITVWVKDEVQFVRMGVTDTGVGIPKDEISKLFNKFEQVKATKEKAKGHGTGLGLAIVKQIVEGLGGKIGVESELNKGTTFYFMLHKSSADELAAAAQA